MNTQFISRDMMEALKYMARLGIATTGRTGLSRRTFRALIGRGLVRECLPMQYVLTDDGIAYMEDKA